MATKVLRRKEVELGFVQIPTKYRSELIGENPQSFDTMVNGEPAKVDKYGRIKSESLKSKYPINTKVRITRNEAGFQVTLSESKDGEPLINHSSPFPETIKHTSL